MAPRDQMRYFPAFIIPLTLSNLELFLLPLKCCNSFFFVSLNLYAWLTTAEPNERKQTHTVALSISVWRDTGVEC